MFINTEVAQFEVGVIINNNRTSYLATNFLSSAKEMYNKLIQKYNNEYSRMGVSYIKHVVFIFDYDKNENIEYYDSDFDIF